MRNRTKLNSEGDFFYRSLITREPSEFTLQVDPKRPFGNSDIYGYIAKILGWTYDEADKLLNEFKIVLQIVLATQKFETGEYLNYDKYDNTKWCNLS